MNAAIIVIALAVVAIFAAIIAFAMKAENKKTAEILSNLSEEQKNRLMNVEIHHVKEKKNCWVQEMLIVKAADKGNKVVIKAIYYNLTITNNTYKTFCQADFSAPRDQFAAKGLSEGAFADVFVNPEKGAKLA